MRIAVSGTHATGKTSLVADLGARLPGHHIVPEPYEILEDRGYEFAFPPSVEDYVVQLRQSIAALRRQSLQMIFDRCPLDFLGYIHASPGADRFDLERWREPIVAAMQSLDLVVAVHVDPIYDPPMFIEDAAFRLAVDEGLREIVDGDAFDLCDGVEILSLGGPWDSRADLVMAHVATLRNSRPAAKPRGAPFT